MDYDFLMAIWLAALLTVFVAAILLEGKRQERKYGRGSGRSAMGAGLLELQRHLEPSRKVELLLEEREQIEEGEGVGAPPAAGDSVSEDSPCSRE